MSAVSIKNKLDLRIFYFEHFCYEIGIGLMCMFENAILCIRFIYILYFYKYEF